MLVTRKLECRSCEERFPENNVLDLGEQTIVDFLDAGAKGRGSAPLQLVRCGNCGLVQLRHTVDADTLYRKFWYRSSINEQMRRALRDVVDCACRSVNVGPGDWVLDIGSNDGELLLNYPFNIGKVGFEPAIDLLAESQRRFQEKRDYHYELWPGYFEANAAMESSKGHPYKVITAIAMFYDLDNPLGFLQDVREVLSPDGVFIVQMNYIGLMLRNLAFDNIGHEHLCYYSLLTLRNLFHRAGLEIFDAELNGVNGGSIRVLAAHKETSPPISFAVESMLRLERKTVSEHSLRVFSERVEEAMFSLLSFLKELKKKGEKVYAYGASTRGMTLLQTLFSKDPSSVDCIIAAAERDEKKYGKRMAGLDIPIVPEEEARKNADYMLVLPYHFWESIQEREKLWMMNGGKFILPVPYPQVVSLEEIGLVSTGLENELVRL